MPARARGAADDDYVLHEGRIHAGPIVGLLAGHGEADDGVEFRDAEVGGEELVLGADAVAVVEGFGEAGRVGGGGGFAVAEHGDDDDVVGGEGGGGGGGEGEGGVDVAAVAGGDADGFVGGGVVGAVGEGDGEGGAGGEGEGGDGVVLDACWVVG